MAALGLVAAAGVLATACVASHEEAEPDLGLQRQAYLPYLGQDVIPPLSQCTVPTTPQFDLPYATRATPAAWNKFDYYPCNPQNPTVVFVHGGGWKSGDKALASFATDPPTPPTVQPAKGVWQVVDQLRSKGFNVVSANYRLVLTAGGALSGVKWPEPLNDIKCLLSFMASNGPAYGDTNNILLWGHSAGGHLAAMAAYTDNTQFDQGANCGSTGTYRITRLILGSPPIDLANPSPSPSPNKADIQRLLGTTTWTSTDIANARAASPMTAGVSPPMYVKSSSPKTLLLTGNTDGLVIPDNNAKLVRDFFASQGRDDKWVNYVIPPGTNAHNDTYLTSLVGNGSPAEPHAQSQIDTFLTPLQPACGDGFKTTPMEACDDGNTDACGTCSADCQTAIPPTAATGSITALPAGNIPDGKTITLLDGIHSTGTVFEFDKNNSIAAGNIKIALVTGQTAGTVATLIRDAINGVTTSLVITASVSGTKVNLLNDQAGSFGNRTITTTHTAFVIAGMSGGLARNCAAKNCTSQDDCAPDFYCDSLGECAWSEE